MADTTNVPIHPAFAEAIANRKLTAWVEPFLEAKGYHLTQRELEKRVVHAVGNDQQVWHWILNQLPCRNGDHDDATPRSDIDSETPSEPTTDEEKELVEIGIALLKRHGMTDADAAAAVTIGEGCGYPSVEDLLNRMPSAREALELVMGLAIANRNVIVALEEGFESLLRNLKELEAEKEALKEELARLRGEE